MKNNQRVRILKYCQKHGSITIREASDYLRMNSPSKRISEMRLSGEYSVKEVWEEKINAFGERVRYKRYFIKEIV